MTDYLGYKDKKVLVTGAASGMGKAVSEILLDLGAEVYGLDLNQSDLPIEKFVQVNLAEKDSIDHAFTELPEKFDAYFGIAGLSGNNLNFNLTYTVNFIANKYITEKYLSNRLNDDGAIMYVASNAGARWRNWKEQFKDIIEANSWEEAVELLEAKEQTAGVAGYVASKRSIVQYSKYILPKFAEKNIRVNTVSPGVTATPLLKDFQEMSNDSKVAGQLGIRKVFAETKEIANTIIFINSDMATYIGGHDLLVDDGREGLIQLESNTAVEKDNINIVVETSNQR